MELVGSNAGVFVLSGFSIVATHGGCHALLRTIAAC